VKPPDHISQEAARALFMACDELVRAIPQGIGDGLTPGQFLITARSATLAQAAVKMALEPADHPHDQAIIALINAALLASSILKVSIEDIEPPENRLSARMAIKDIEESISLVRAS